MEAKSINAYMSLSRGELKVEPELLEVSETLE